MSTVKKEMLSLGKVLVLGLVLSLCIKHFIFSPYVVKGASMAPNLQEENKLVVNKLSLGKYKRFDIIVFQAPDEDEFYVKRVIGLPGDTIRMKNDVLYINGKAYNESYLKTWKESKNKGFTVTHDFTLEELTGHKKVPKGFVFVLGDNRAISKDSRYFGLLPKESVIGKAVFRVWPFTEAGKVH